MKTILPIFGILPILITLSFADLHTEKRIMRILLTANRVTEFDMIKNGMPIKGIKTPYELVIPESKGNFIFKTSRSKEGLQLNLKNDCSNLTAKWQVIDVVVGVVVS